MRKAAPLLLVLLLLACESSPGGGAADVTGGADVPPAVCGDGRCEVGEDCLACPADCACACGDGLCTFGEYPAICPADCASDQLAATPPMGWNSWNRFACDVSATLIEEMAEAMVTSGMRDVGYEYVNVDDCWQVARDEDGEIVADPERFPEGMGALAAAVHAKGLKFGLYTDAGRMTCQERPGSYGFEAKDAARYAAWGVDYVKVDWCFSEGLSSPEQYAIMGEALANAGRPMVYSICNWGVDGPWIWGPDTGHLWRTTGDIADFWESMVLNLIGSRAYAGAAGPGHWNDPDMLEVGNGGMEIEEYRSHFALWAVMAAPLIAGNDLRSMDEETRAILTHPELIAVDQDPDGIQGVQLPTSGDITQVWARPLRQHGARAVVLFNAGPSAREVAVTWADLGLQGPAQVRDLWAREDLGGFETGYARTLASHASAALLVVGEEHQPAAGRTPLQTLPWMHAAEPGGAVAWTDEALTVGAPSLIVHHLGGRCERLEGEVFVNPASRADATARFEVLGDDAPLWSSELMRQGDAPATLDLSLSGRRTLRLRVRTTGTSVEGVHATWSALQLTCR